MLRSANHKRATEPYLACQSTSCFRSAANMAIKTNRRTWRAVKFGPYKISVDRYICARARRPFPNPCMQKSPVFFRFYPCKSRVHGSLAKTLVYSHYNNEINMDIRRHYTVELFDQSVQLSHQYKKDKNHVLNEKKGWEAQCELMCSKSV